MDDRVAFFRLVDAAGGAAADHADVDLDAAIEKHAEWRLKLRAAISHREELVTATIAKDNCCQSGQWLYGAGRSKFGTRREFPSLVAMHKVFRAEAAEVSELINERQYAEAERALNNGTSYSDAPVSVHDAIVTLKSLAAA